MSASGDTTGQGRVPRAPGLAQRRFWNDPRVRAVFYQILVLALVAAGLGYLASNAITNLETRGIRTGFDFLREEAGFVISESLIDYRPADSYLRAFVVGMLNTLKVSVLGIVLATIIGTLVGIIRLSPNWLLARIASVYVEALRNVPLLLQLFFWYALIVHILPPPLDAPELLPSVFLSKSGLQLAVPVYDPIHLYVLAALVVGVGAAWGYRRWADRRHEATGFRPPVLLPAIGIIVGLPLIVFLLGGAPLEMDIPEPGRFRIAGGTQLSPEFLALLIGLTLYTSSFIAETVRSGILSVPRGQAEAAGALGLRRGQIMRLVVLPQALRVIVPPITSQYLNLTKNSSLAVAIGYPDLVSASNTTLNQTGQAIECIALIMLVYLTISLSISFAMNLYNRSIALKER